MYFIDLSSFDSNLVVLNFWSLLNWIWNAVEKTSAFDILPSVSAPVMSTIGPK